MKPLRVVLALTILGAWPAWAGELDEPGADARRPTSLPASPPAPASAPARRGGAEYRFDALRVDGRLHGPEALVVRSMTGDKRGKLLRLGRSFVHRIFESLEDASLGPGAGHR